MRQRSRPQTFAERVGATHDEEQREEDSYQPPVELLIEAREIKEEKAYPSWWLLLIGFELLAACLIIAVAIVLGYLYVTSRVPEGWLF
ncbi:MAG TPA: hypothetical protein VFC51_00375 [Chloroflexota bacterium]|nr:hypothetical protein [Chloroflexota bacterium]